MMTDGADFEANVCAACGKAEVDNVKLKKCNACKSVRYCGVECQKKHRPQHKRACKKRAVELRDDILFRQPESSHYGDCPICFLPLPLTLDKFTKMSCCSVLICRGCYYANKTRERKMMLEGKCPFCRQPIPRNKEEISRNEMKRVEANDPVAIRQMGATCYHIGDFGGAFEYYTRAARLGNVEAHWNLSNLYEDGEGVEKDKKKELYHMEEAAIGGHSGARFSLGVKEWENGRIERAVKHFTIDATLGNVDSMENLRRCYEGGLVSKEDFAAALRAHQATVDAMKSPQREALEKKRYK
jgi:hypothetical protein